MAKSLRSKHKRKMRAEKRKKNAPKELTRLKKALGTEVKAEEVMEDVQELITLVKPTKLAGGKVNDVDMEGDADDGKMELDKKRNKTTQLDENGQYPAWMSGRKVKKLRRQRKAKKSKKYKLPQGIAW